MDAACQALLRMGISQTRILEWVAMPSSRIPNPGIKSRSPALQVDSLPCEPPGKPMKDGEGVNLGAKSKRDGRRLRSYKVLCVTSHSLSSAHLLPAPLQGWIHVTFRFPLCITSGWPSRVLLLPKTAHHITLFIFFKVLTTFGYSFIYICMYCLSLLSEMQRP